MNSRVLSVFLLSVSLVFSGCSNNFTSPKKDAADRTLLTVNGDRITARDVQRELALRAKQDPSFKVTPETSRQQLETIINRRVMIQEAARRHLAEEESFVNTIRAFWEQTLIRNLISQVNAEVAKSITVSDAEVRQFYGKLSENVSFDVAISPNRKTAEGLAAKIKAGEEIKWDQKLGPAGFIELASPALEDAFTMKTGQWKLYFENDMYYLVRVLAREPVTPPALEEARKQIEDILKQRKLRDRLEDWLKEKRSKAKIVIVPKK